VSFDDLVALVRYILSEPNEVVRIHDLRHSFASFLVNAGRSLYEVQKILGHTQVKTTQRYAHLSQDTLIDAANEVAKVVPLLIAAE
jgi:site-specific recombinase XerD